MKMKFDSLCDLEDLLRKTLVDKGKVSFVSDIDTVLEVAIDFYAECYESTFDRININRIDYDKEYMFTAEYYNDEVVMFIQQVYVKDKYAGTDGVVYIDKNVDPQFIKDCVSNPHIPGFTPIIVAFSYDEDDEPDCENCENSFAEREENGAVVKYIVPKCMVHVVESIDEVLAEMLDLIMD